MSYDDDVYLTRTEKSQELLKQFEQADSRFMVGMMGLFIAVVFAALGGTVIITHQEHPTEGSVTPVVASSTH